MRAMHMKALSGGLAAGALLITVGCGAAQKTSAAIAQEAAAAPAGTPVVVNCEPYQRAVVRPTVVNGVAMSQVDCIAADPAAATAAAASQPFAVATAPARAQRVAYADLEPARVVPMRESYGAARPIRTNQVVYSEPVKKTRSVKKSAIIIGSSAGAGAGVGALVGGKKGALIGAAIGGGGAAIWDQLTRR